VSEMGVKGFRLFEISALEEMIVKWSRYVRLVLSGSVRYALSRVLTRTSLLLL